LAPLQDPRKLEHSARQVASGRTPTRDVRKAVRELSLAALRSRVLSVRHVARVASAVAQGIDPRQFEGRTPAQPGRGTAQAAEGLIDTIDVALCALEVAAREFVTLGGRLHAGADAELEELDAVSRSLTGLVPRNARGSSLGARIDCLRGHIRLVISSEENEGEQVLGLLATGALLGLLESARGPGEAPQPIVSTAAPSKAP
jgi:hypothetical protein